MFFLWLILFDYDYNLPLMKISSKVSQKILLSLKTNLKKIKICRNFGQRESMNMKSTGLSIVFKYYTRVFISCQL